MVQSTLTKTKHTVPAAPPKSRGKRPDIQGLRAIAVFAVILDHLLHWPSGGFVGVDVFFVISGFLITGLLLREYDQTSTISFSGFYRRRIRRIMPAALIVLAATSAAAYWLYNEARANETFADVIWSLLFAANWHFSVIGTDYFQAGGPVSPLQHFWSLAVEEQFYLVWPWLMALIFWLGGRTSGWDKVKARRFIAVTMCVIVALSFIWAVHQSTASPTLAYFSTLTRAWELGVGALIAVFATAFAKIPDVLRPVLAYIGLAGIILSIFLVSADVSFPAPWAAAPVVATALVIIAGTGGAQRFMWPLTNKTMGYLGDISYSLYLWHFPVITFAQLFLLEDLPTFYAVSLAAMLVLGIASFHLVEEPVRKSGWLLPQGGQNRKTRLVPTRESAKYAGLAVLAVVTAVACWAALFATAPVDRVGGTPTASAPLSNALPTASANPVDDSAEGVLSAEIVDALASPTFPEFIPAIESLGTESWAKRPEIACMNVNSGNMATCLTGPPEGTKTAVVLGDSFAVAWLPGIRAALEPQGYKVQALTMGQCPAAIVRVTQEGGAAFPACETHQQWAIDRVRAIQPDLTVIASSQDSTMRRLASSKIGQDAVAEIMTGLQETITEITGSTGRVALLGSPPPGKNLQACVTRIANPGSCISELTNDWKALRDAEKTIIPASNVIYVDVTPWFCNNDGYCPGFVGRTPVRVDTGHMTVEYAQKLAPVLSNALAGGGT